MSTPTPDPEIVPTDDLGADAAFRSTARTAYLDGVPDEHHPDL